MANLPLLLAGPVVRRVESTTAGYWFALSKPASVTATVWAGMQSSNGSCAVASNAADVASGQASSRRFGAQLHVAGVTATTTGAAYTPGAAHAYDLALTPKDVAFKTTDLAKPKSLVLGHTPGQLPRVVLSPPPLPGLRLAHASCRTMHARGPDATEWLADHRLRYDLAEPSTA